jgi:diazepam-binding inhibitor (GABA receptor modulating acyl-CoA-binding protein)
MSVYQRLEYESKIAPEDDIETLFGQCVEYVNELDYNPGTVALLNLYGMFKQATVGNVTEERPGPFSIKARKKYDAWETQKGKSRQQAMHEYVIFVSENMASD